MAQTTNQQWIAALKEAANHVDDAATIDTTS
jgi:hypothetical protein